MIRPWLLTLMLLCASAASHAAAASSLARFRVAHAALQPHVTSDGYEVDRSAAATAALRAQWSAARDVATDWLNRHPAKSLASLGQHAKPAGLILAATPLDRDALLVSASSGAFGTVFLLHRGLDGRYRSFFALDDLPAGASRTFPALAAWRPDHAGGSCRQARGADGWSYCGPQAVQAIIPLARETSGARRFAVIGDYVKPAGSTEGYQVSIWRWDGRTATPLLLRTMAQSIEEPLLVREDKGGFTLRERKEFQAFGSCGPCAGRQVQLRFDMPSTGATPPRMRSLYPDMELVDRLYARLSAHRSTVDLAAPAVAARLKNVEVDMLGQWRPLGATGGHRRLCVDAMGFDRPQIFDIVTRAGRPWISAVTFARAHACDGPAARS